MYASNITMYVVHLCDRKLHRILGQSLVKTLSWVLQCERLKTEREHVGLGKIPKHTHTREKLNGKKYFPCLKNVILSWRQPHAEVHPSPCSVSCFTYFSVILILTDTHWAKDSHSYGLVSLKACSQTSGKQLVAELRTTAWAMVAFIVLQSKSVPSIIKLQC